MRKLAIGGLLVSIWLPLIFASCDRATKKGEEPVSEEEKLARTHCSSCHAFPEPALLDKQTWATGVLPKMAELMQGTQAGQLKSESGDLPGDTAAMEPVPKATWDKIVAYYTNSVPENLVRSKDSLAPISI